MKKTFLFSVLLSAALLTACGGDPNPSPSTGLEVTPAQLSLSAAVSGTTEQPLSVKNTGTAAVDFTASSSGTGFSVTPTSGTLAAGQTGTLTVKGTCPAQAGTLTGTVTIAAGGGSKQVNVSLVCSVSAVATKFSIVPNTSNPNLAKYLPDGRLLLAQNATIPMKLVLSDPPATNYQDFSLCVDFGPIKNLSWDKFKADGTFTMTTGPDFIDDRYSTITGARLLIVGSKDCSISAGTKSSRVDVISEGSSESVDRLSRIGVGMIGKNGKFYATGSSGALLDNYYAEIIDSDLKTAKRLDLTGFQIKNLSFFDTPFPQNRFMLRTWNSSRDSYRSQRVGLFTAEGNKLWQYDYTYAHFPSGEVKSGKDGTVYLSYDSRTVALSATGAKLWEVVVPYGQYYAVDAVAQDGTLYLSQGAVGNVVGDGTTGTIPYIKDVTKLVALKPDGTVKWTKEVTGHATVGSDGTVYAGVPEGLQAYKPDGSKKWLASIAGGVNLTETYPYVGPSGTVYFPGKLGKVYAYKSDGTLKWSYDSPFRRWKHFVESPSGRFYFDDGGSDPVRYKSDPSNLNVIDPTGKLIYRVERRYDIPIWHPDGRAFLMDSDLEQFHTFDTGQ